jgi:hypothetical protein
MGLRTTQGDEKCVLSSNRSPWERLTPLCHPAQPRDLQFRGPFVEMFFEAAQWQQLFTGGGGTSMAGLRSKKPSGRN